MRHSLGAALTVAPCPSVCPPVRPSVPCLRFSRKKGSHRHW